MEIVLVLLVFLALPAVLIVFGAKKKRTRLGGKMLISGLVLLSFSECILLSYIVGKLLCLLLAGFGISAEFTSTTPIAVVLVLVMMYVNDKLYKAIMR